MDINENIYEKAYNKFSERCQRVLKSKDLHGIAAIYAEYYNAVSAEDGDASEVLKTQLEMISGLIISVVMENEGYCRTNATGFDKWNKID